MFLSDNEHLFLDGFVGDWLEEDPDRERGTSGSIERERRDDCEICCC